MSPTMSNMPSQKQEPKSGPWGTLALGLVGLATLLVTALLAQTTLQSVDALGGQLRGITLFSEREQAGGPLHLSFATLIAAHGSLILQATLSFAALAAVLCICIFCPVEIALAGFLPAFAALITSSVSFVILASVGSSLLTGITIRWALRHAALRRQARENPLLINFSETV